MQVLPIGLIHETNQNSDTILHKEYHQRYKLHGNILKKPSSVSRVNNLSILIYHKMGCKRVVVVW